MHIAWLGQSDDLVLCGLVNSLTVATSCFHFFLQSNSPSPDDLVPGVYALTQSWVQEAVLGSFRDSADQNVDLAAWFASPWVQGYAQVRSWVGVVYLQVVCSC
jgi:hypothetical protein